MARCPESSDQAAHPKADRRVVLICAVCALLMIASVALVAVKASRPATGDLASQLCDPDSMRTRDVHQTEQTVTGQVNARSPAGGYSGFIPFTVDRRTGHAEILSADNWEAECRHVPTEDRHDLFIPNGFYDAH